MIYFAVACRGVLGLVFLVSAATKLRNLAGFEASVRDLRLLPNAAARPAAMSVAACELATIPLLAVPATATAGLLLCIGLLLVFSVAIAIVLGRGTVATCGCFGPSRAPLGRPHLVRSVILCGVAITGALASTAPPAPIHPGGVAVALVAAAVVASVAIMTDELVALFPAPTYREARR